MKAILTFILLLVFSGIVSAQCPTAGRDTAITYCKNELFDLANLRSGDADLGGAFVDPMNDTMTVTTTSLVFPGQYHYFYKVSGTGCPNDSAEFVITIQICGTGGLSESFFENTDLFHPNPASNRLILNEINFDLLEVYSSTGSCVLTHSCSFNSVIDISTLEQGNYILVLEKNGIKQFQRFMKE